MCGGGGHICIAARLVHVLMVRSSICVNILTSISFSQNGKYGENLASGGNPIEVPSTIIYCITTIENT